MTRRITRGFDPVALKRAREEHPNEDLRRRAEVARLAGVGVATIQQWEAGKKSPQVNLLFRVAAVLGVPMEQLVPIPREQRYLRDWRVLRGMLESDLAARTGISGSSIGRLEEGSAALTDENANRLAEALGITATEVRAAYDRARNRAVGAPA
ncbi:helix-turn-helix transcriptional regulator [Nocardia farcinica]|uniref:helix-turn-helix domain-containing protein n=1 Tax=Nocardia farcinica TaxID=37329 RepID=UPI0018949EC7|nr:helix-turn-helix transcriptional regulator [Nocardia farcinica]MBF6253905.1 helix-turn-helix transcriptional regulator [Nocardia farcinica]MBF6265444.1 helix-turn-helix transcriptional regulator [Nocardia farcinica]MBF6284044.1 helix-turn-helix transcriptional regulator [Nocardia farcinica]MBF6308076.1 helix-turn-helix transcriptional regulator [Nocardia farcinica]MBF6511677.1 helix-turn-helix transcriptional regulator [Nocardia farcinica]